MLRQPESVRLAPLYSAVKLAMPCWLAPRPVARAHAKARAARRYKYALRPWALESCAERGP